MQTSLNLRASRAALVAARLPCRPACAGVARRPARLASVAVHARSSASGGRSSSGGSPGIVERVLAALPYMLPFFDVVAYGRYLFYMYPAVKAAIQPLLPAISAYHSLPFGSFIAFFALYLGVVNNPSVHRFVRFNAVQAILLDILLVLPRLLETVLTPPTVGWGAQLYIHSQSFIWVFTTMWVLYGMVNCFLGQRPLIPFISDAAEQQLR
ncbi:Protein TIC 20-II, chloroplastic [Tetrabaena socialis]|uniref:Protein TIC 20 n=1 Tax=Tetrabaena socialis TaxID=47790 RepID=A0A2J8A5M2_9CHLO|nr:Protein TIC 20-II, chloroplastic [Tetrabaena socialis]|eukprot:PNH07821.1 Protein TIC 20-II, chloroplastic [Tetrabaena socialis]